MTIRRLTAFVATAGLILALAACGGGGSKNSATKTPTTKTPSVTGTVTPKTTAAGNQTPGAAPPTSQDGGATPGSGTAPGTGATQANPNAGQTPVTGAHTNYRVQFTVASDPANIRQLVEDRGRLPSRLTFTIGNGAVSIDGSRPFFKVTGTIDASGIFTATGMGDIEPYANIEATFQGTVSNGQLTGTYAVGSNGGLPGAQPLTYNVTGTSQVPTPGG